jgi:hypothetical protein
VRKTKSVFCWRKGNWCSPLFVKMISQFTMTSIFISNAYLLEWLYSPCGPSPLFSFLLYFSTIGRTPWMSDQLIARPLPKLLDGKWPIILLRGPLEAWGTLTCSKFTTRVKILKSLPEDLFPEFFLRRPPPGLNPRRSSHEVGTLHLQRLWTL